MFSKKKPDAESRHAAATALADEAVGMFTLAADALVEASTRHLAVAEEARQEADRLGLLATRANASSWLALKRADKIREFLA